MKKSTLFKIRNSEVGFTLVEVLVTVAVTGILTLMATVIFINTVRNSKKAEVTAEGRQNAALVIDRLQKDARGALSLSVNNVPSGSTKETLTIESNSGDTIVWKYIDPGPNDVKYITRSVAGSDLTVTNKDPIDGISIGSCDFTQGAGGTDFVDVSFTVTETPSLNSASQEYDVNLKFQTSISTRGN